MQKTCTAVKHAEPQARLDPNLFVKLEHSLYSVRRDSSGALIGEIGACSVWAITAATNEFACKHPSDGSFGNKQAIASVSSPLAVGAQQRLSDALKSGQGSNEDTIQHKALSRTDAILNSIRCLKPVRWYPRFGRRACSENGHDIQRTRSLSIDSRFKAKSGSTCKSRQTLSGHRSSGIPDIVVLGPEDTQQTGTCPELSEVEILYTENSSGPQRAITEPLEASAEEWRSRFECLGFNGDIESETMMEDDSRSELVPVPDVDGGSDCGDLEDNDYWTWDVLEQQFKHWDEENQNWVYCPDEFD